MTDENPIFEHIRKELNEHDVVLFMKGTQDAPMCGFSAVVVQVMDRLSVKDYKVVNVLEDPEIRQGIKEFTDWPTIPQLYVKGEFIGGCDIIREMYESGELADLMKEKGVAAA